jgi:hypothetical protein
MTKITDSMAKKPDRICFFTMNPFASGCMRFSIARKRGLKTMKKTADQRNTLKNGAKSLTTRANNMRKSMMKKRFCTRFAILHTILWHYA